MYMVLALKVAFTFTNNLVTRFQNNIRANIVHKPLVYYCVRSYIIASSEACDSRAQHIWMGNKLKDNLHF